VKNQYFGDINDYRKYGLIRAILSATKLRMLVAWMLTPDDKSTDGKFISYLDAPTEWSRHDPELFNALRDALQPNGKRHVDLIEQTDLLPQAEYFSAIVPDAAVKRDEWFRVLSERARASELVFLDPDNGLEVKSRPYGNKASSKFLFWREVEALWSGGKSLLIYQHFVRENRVQYIQRKLDELKAAAPGSTVEAFSTSHVVFLMALQPKHQQFHSDIVQAVQDRWKGQIATPFAPLSRSPHVV
jgi:hypothetical protein